jgi:hypothetical protein
MAREHGVGRGTPDDAVPARVFLGIGALVAVLAAVYGATAYEEAGTALLVLAAALALWCGAYLWLRRRSGALEADAGGTDDDVAEALFLPHASPWPFTIGFGTFLLANGLIAGGWFFLPGAAVLAAGIGGFIRESRSR